VTTLEKELSDLDLNLAHCENAYIIENVDCRQATPAQKAIFWRDRIVQGINMTTLEKEPSDLDQN
jgi:hypothetical protein